MRLYALAAGAAVAALLTANPSCSATSHKPGAGGPSFTGSCTMLPNTGVKTNADGSHTTGKTAQISYTNQGSTKATVSGVHIEGFNNGARVADFTYYLGLDHVGAGKTHTVIVWIDPRSQSCEVTEFEA